MKRNSIYIITSLMFFVLINVRCNSDVQLADFKSTNDTMRIFIQQRCLNEKYNIILRFDSVVNESRCPYGAECF